MKAESGDPLVSVVIPARNEEGYVETALNSVAGQNYPVNLLECIVVDSASNDRTVDVVEDFVRRRGALAASVIREPAPGAGRAKNRGVAIAQGDVLIFLDADSWLEANLVRNVVDAWRAGYPAGSIRIVADSHHPLERGYFALMQVGPALFGVRGQMFYCDRLLFLSLGGFQPELQLAEDLDFLRRVRKARARESVCHIRGSFIATSTRRLREKPLHLNMLLMFARWTLAFAGIGRTRHY